MKTEWGEPTSEPRGGELAFAGNIRFSRKKMAANTSSPLRRWGFERASGISYSPYAVFQLLLVAVLLSVTGFIASAQAQNISLIPTNCPFQLGFYSRDGNSPGGSIFFRQFTLPDHPTGHVVAWGGSGFGQTPAPRHLTNVAAIDAGVWHSIALRNDGTVAAFGDNSEGQTDVPPGLTNVIAVAAGDLHNLALRSDGTVVAWGYNCYGQTNVPPNLSGVVAVAGGIYHSVALKNDGTVVGWGYNAQGQCNTPPGCTNVVAIAAGGNHSAALKRDGTVTAWGWEPEHQMQLPAHWTNIVMLACGSDHVVGLKADRTLVAWAFSQFGSCFNQTNIPASATNVATVGTGRNHTLALRMDGAVVGWGGCDYGECVAAAGLTNVVALAGGSSHSVALIADGAPWLVAGPTNRIAFTGTSAEFAVLVAGATPISLQWQFQGTNLPGATGARVALPEVKFSDAGNYCVVASNEFGIVTSPLATLTVLGCQPFIVRQPAAQSALPSGQAAFDVVADGSRPLWYQWCFDGAALPGATNATLLLSNLIPDNAGGYTVIVTNSFGSVTSPVATLTVLPVHTGPGSLDFTFDPMAASTLPGIECGSYPPSVSGLVIQPDGKMVIGGMFDSINGIARSGVARLNPDGTLDTSFQFACSNDLAAGSLVAQPDQKILFLGRRLHSGEPRPPCTGLVRLNADGRLDPNFTNYWSGDWVPYVRCLALQADGRILVGGEFMAPRTGLARFNSDGTLDETFIPPDLPAYDGAGVNSIVVQPDGKILVAGDWGIGFFRLNADGSEDADFNPTSDVADRLTAFRLQPDGRILVGLRGCCGECASLARLHLDGSMDNSFVSSKLDTIPITLALCPDGRILVSGYSAVYRHEASIYRLYPDGTLDSTFQVHMDAWHGWPSVAAMVLQSDGQILVAGSFSSVNGFTAVGLTRLNSSEMVCRLNTQVRPSPGPFQMLLTGVPGSKYGIQASTDLIAWTPLMTVTNICGRVQFGDPGSTNFNRRFYRARLVEQPH
jgi:uncharacterized delta-60 repeat protein